MISFKARLIRAFLRLYTYPYRKNHKSLSRSVSFKNKAYNPPEGFTFDVISAGGVRTEVLYPKNPAFALIHFHGGGHTAGMNDMYRKVAERYAILCNAAVCSIDYDTGKDLVYPSLHDQTFSAYSCLARNLKMPFAAAGDSFGADLMLSALIRAREEKQPLPRAILCVSPFADMAASGDSYKANCHKDPLYGLPLSQSFEKHEQHVRRISPYFGSTPLRDKFLSPAYAELHSFSDMLIICGSLETSASDGAMIYKNAVGAGVKAKLHSYDGMWHDFLYLFPDLKESKEAWGEICRFFKSALKY